MEMSYSVNREKGNKLIPIVIILVVLVIGGLVFLVVKGKAGLISPLPETPAVEIIFYTPTPAEVTPTATASASPGIEKKVTAVPTKPKPTATPKASSPTSASVTSTGNP